METQAKTLSPNLVVSATIAQRARIGFWSWLGEPENEDWRHLYNDDARSLWRVLACPPLAGHGYTLRTQALDTTTSLGLVMAKLPKGQRPHWFKAADTMYRHRMAERMYFAQLAALRFDALNMPRFDEVFVDQGTLWLDFTRLPMSTPPSRFCAIHRAWIMDATKGVIVLPEYKQLSPKDKDGWAAIADVRRGVYHKDQTTT